MKKFKKICTALLAAAMLSVSALAANFAFDFNQTGTDYSSLATKSNGKSFATVTISTAPSSATYKYAVAKGIFRNYVSDWKQKRGTGTIDITYTSRPDDGIGVRLHGATVSASGTTRVTGTWIP